MGGARIVDFSVMRVLCIALGLQSLLVGCFRFQTTSVIGSSSLLLSHSTQRYRNNRRVCVMTQAHRMPQMTKSSENISEAIYDIYNNEDEDMDTPDVRLAELPRLVNDDQRVNRSSLMPQCVESTMEICFVGTASCMPVSTRGVSCTVLRRGKESMVFDAGEGTQKLIHESRLKPNKIKRIFLTHAHGDHCFGLIGLLCTIGMMTERGGPAVDIYGPQGLRNYLRIAAQFTMSRIVAPYRVHEMMDIPCLMKSRRAWNNRQYNVIKPDIISSDPSFGELPGGRDIYSDADGCYTLIDEEQGIGLVAPPPPELMDIIKQALEDEEDVEDSICGSHEKIKGFGEDSKVEYSSDEVDESRKEVISKNDSDLQRRVLQSKFDGSISALPFVKVRAAPMVHSIPCVGFVVEESNRIGKLNASLVMSRIYQNHKALSSDHNLSDPMALSRVIKLLQPDESFVFPDGSSIYGRDAVGPSICGRKVVICGDTCDASRIAPLAMDCDVLVHEATNTFLKDRDKSSSIKKITKSSIKHGHSTPFMAGAFAKTIRAKRLVLHHFSSRYAGDDSARSVLAMLRIEDQARRASHLPVDKVHAAWDLSSFMIHHPKQRETEE